MSELIDELKWRGLVAQHTDMEQLEAAFSEGPVTFYCGFDPTAPSLHHGHLVQLLLMRHLQNAGHRPLALVGGATGLIGDPREVGERSMQSTDVVEKWVEKLRKQIERFLDFDEDAENSARIVNNLEWTGPLSAIEFLREIGKHFRLGTMLSKDVVARRLESDEGISYTEFSYQILQAHDFLELNKRYGCTLQTGGNDQWGNLIGGVDYIRKTSGNPVHVMTTPVVTKADGTKFGKSTGGAIWLDPELLSPYDFYQFWLQTADEDVVKMLKVFTFRNREEIEDLAQQVSSEPHLRAAQKALAADVTALVHGEAELERVLGATEAIWGKGDLWTSDGPTLAAAAENLARADITLGESTVVDAAVAAGLVGGRGAARRLIESNGLSVNGVKVADPEMILGAEHVLPAGFVLLRKGRRNLAAAWPIG